MAGETFIAGNAVILSIYDTDAYEPIGCLTSNSLSESRDVNETATKCDPGNIIRTAGTYSYELSGDGRYIDETVDTGRQSHNKLAGYMRAGTVLTWRLTTGITTPTEQYGTGILTSLELTGETNADAEFSFTIAGIGAIVSVDPNA